MKPLHTKKLRFYSNHTIKSLVPYFYLKRRLPIELAQINRYNPLEIFERVDYYCKPQPLIAPSAGWINFRDLSIWEMASLPCMDLKQYLRYFPRNFQFNCDFNDLNIVPAKPTFVKCRPIGPDNGNSVLMKLNSGRFFDFPKDRLSFQEKKPVAVYRGPCYKKHRQEFVNKCHALPQTDIGDTRKAVITSTTYRPFMSIAAQLENKFIISVEGNDVSSSIKWIMASNSLAFMTKPKFEGWFMQGKLIPNHHFVLLRDDYSDLSEKIDYYSRNTDAALEIIANAHKHVEQFFDYKREKLISLLVAQKYFALSGQSKV
jgi:hypothetical protein